MQFYKPNPRVTGTGCGFKLSVKDNGVMVNFIRQSGWDDSTKRGSFAGNMKDPKNTVSLKINSIEMGEIIACIRKKTSYSTYHKSANQNLSIKFEPYMRGTKENPTEKVQVGYSLSVHKTAKENSQDKSSFVIGFSFGETVVLESYFLFCLSRIFDEEAYQQSEKDKAYFANRKSQQSVVEQQADGEAQQEGGTVPDPEGDDW